MTEPKSDCLTLYHCPGMRSTRALWMYYELKERYGSRPEFPELRVELFDRGQFRTEKPAWYLKLNPNGKVPTLVDGDIVIWESVAICDYLLERYDYDGLLSLPNDPKYRALHHQMSHYTSGTLDNLTAYSSTIQRVMKEPTPWKNPERLAENLKFFELVAGPMLVDILKDRLYFYGDSFTALDVVLGYQFFVLIRKNEPDFLANFPTLKAYTSRISKNANLLKANQG